MPFLPPLTTQLCSVPSVGYAVWLDSKYLLVVLDKWGHFHTRAPRIHRYMAKNVSLLPAISQKISSRKAGNLLNISPQAINNCISIRFLINFMLIRKNFIAAFSRFETAVVNTLKDVSIYLHNSNFIWTTGSNSCKDEINFSMIRFPVTVAGPFQVRQNIIIILKVEKSGSVGPVQLLINLVSPYFIIHFDAIKRKRKKVSFYISSFTAPYYTTPYTTSCEQFKLV